MNSIFEGGERDKVDADSPEWEEIQPPEGGWSGTDTKMKNGLSNEKEAPGKVSSSCHGRLGGRRH